MAAVENRLVQRVSIASIQVHRSGQRRGPVVSNAFGVSGMAIVTVTFVVVDRTAAKRCGFVVRLTCQLLEKFDDVVSIFASELTGAHHGRHVGYIARLGMPRTNPIKNGALNTYRVIAI